MARTYCNLSTWELQDQFKKHKKDRHVVDCILYELDFRKGPGAMRLRDRINNHLANQAPTVQMPRSAPPSPIPVAPTPLPVVALAPVPIPIACQEGTPSRSMDYRPRLWAAVLIIGLILMSITGAVASHGPAQAMGAAASALPVK